MAKIPKNHGKEWTAQDIKQRKNLQTKILQQE